jgi:hypothetical protein
MPKITRVREVGQLEPRKLYFHVYPSPKDGVACGYTEAAGGDGAEVRFLTTTAAGVPVAPAWQEALALAERLKAAEAEVEVVVVDPGGLFPAAPPASLDASPFPIFEREVARDGCGEREPSVPGRGRRRGPASR